MIYENRTRNVNIDEIPKYKKKIKETRLSLQNHYIEKQNSE